MEKGMEARNGIIGFIKYEVIRHCQFTGYVT